MPNKNFTMDKTYERKTKKPVAQLNIFNRAFMLQYEGKPDEHIMATAKALNLKPHIVLYHAHRLQARGMVKLVKVGNMTFIHALPLKAPEIMRRDEV